MKSDFKKAMVIGILGSFWNWIVLWFSKEIAITSATLSKQIFFNVLLISFILTLIVYNLSKEKLIYVSFVPAIWTLINFFLLDFIQKYTFGYWIFSALLISLPIGISIYSIRNFIGIKD